MNFVIDKNCYYKRNKLLKKSDLSNEGITAIVDKLLENTCKSKKQHEQLLIECILLDE